MNSLAKTPLEILDNKYKLKTLSDKEDINGSRHLVKVFPNNLKAIEIFSVNNLVHRENLPAVIEYFFSYEADKEIVCFTKYFNQGECFLIKEFYHTGNLKSVLKCNNFYIHDADGPAIINYNRDGTITNQLYYYKNNLVGENLQISGKDCVFEYFSNSQILS